MKIKRKLDWKDNWISNSTTPMTEMFYKVFERLPTKEELRKMVGIFIVPKNGREVKKKWKEFCEERRRGTETDSN